ncbi:MAG: hypothetical protein O2820_11685 [Planctomycetota bacterium]|nr:hypothetical protein [Planctomycetota bacterium]
MKDTVLKVNLADPDYLMAESISVSHSREDESLLEKARWFHGLSLEQRMEIFCEMSELILATRPELVRNKPHAEPVPGRVQVLEET